MKHCHALRGRAVATAVLALTGMAACGRDMMEPALREDAPAAAASPLARIRIGEHGLNRVGSPHTVTGSVEVAADAGQPFLPVADGTRIDFAIRSGPGSLSAASCTTAGGTGRCAVTLNSTATGVSEVAASSTFTAHGTTFNLTTDFTGDNSGPIAKTWVDAKIAIEPSTDTNPVNEEHTFTVTVWKDFGDGNGFVAVNGETVTAVQSGSLAPVALGGTCTTGATDDSGQCTFTANSSTPGTLTLTASSTVTFGSVESPIASSTRAGQDVTFTVTTNGTGNNSGPAMKTWVGAGSARISIVSDDVNRVGENHRFTVFVERNTGSGFAPVSGQLVTATKTGIGNFVNSSCTTGSDGRCVIEVSSSATGQMIVSASAAVPLDGSTVTVSTNGSNGSSGAATKTWVDAKILVTQSNGTNQLNEEQTFTVTVLKDPGDGGGFVPAPGETVTATQSGSLAPLPLGGTCVSGTTDAAGQCTFTVTSSKPGTITLTPSTTVTVGGRDITVTTSGTATWVGAPTGPQKPASISVDPARYSTVAGSNTATGSFRIANHSGSGTVANIATITLTLQRVHRGNKTTMQDVSCVVTNIRSSSGRSHGPGLPYTIEASPGYAYADFTCTRSGGTFAKGWELKLLQRVTGNPAKKSFYHNTSDFKVR